MRLNENRIDAISLAVVDRLADEEMVDLTLSEEDLANMVSQVITRDLLIEEAIQEESVQWLRQNKSHLEEGTSPWHIELEKQRDRLAIRRGYVLP